MTEATQLEVGIVVRDLAATAPFYQDGLGLPLLSDEVSPFGPMRKLRCGPSIVKLLELDRELAQANPPGGLNAACSGMRWLSIIVDDIEGVLERCERTGGAVVSPIQQWSPTVKMMIIEDPESNCWIEVASKQ